MIVLAFEEITLTEAALAVFTNVITYFILIYSVKLKEEGKPQWLCRKLVHITLSTIIAFVINIFSSLTGPLVTLIMFLLILFGISLFKFDLVTIFLETGTRDNDSKVDTLFASISALVGYAIVTLLFPNNPEIITSSILVVAWGDGAGELIGRPFGKHKLRFWSTKSLEGSLAVFVMSFIAVFMAFIVFRNVNFILALPLFVFVAFIASVLELLAYKWTDNLLLPIINGFILILFMPA